MRKLLFKLLIIVFSILVLISLLNIPVVTRKGVNYKWVSVKMPLYLKLLDFFDRHYNYKNLEVRITEGANNDKERVVSILKWVDTNILYVPDGFPVIDDHVWHIIVRGYGANDQRHDVFSTLCSYAGFKAFYKKLASTHTGKSMLFSFVKINDDWFVFDIDNTVYFTDSNGDFSSLEDLREGNFEIKAIDETRRLKYKYFFTDLKDFSDAGLSRANIQNPFNRLSFKIKKVFFK